MSYSNSLADLRPNAARTKYGINSRNPCFSKSMGF